MKVCGLYEVMSRIQIVWMTICTMLFLTSLGNASEAGAEETTAKEKQEALYLVSSYDPERKPAEDLKTAMQKADASGKHILLQVGGDWCGWCHRMTEYFEKTVSVRDVLKKNYVIIKINFSNENRNEAFLSSYPKVAAFPHLFVLDAKGIVLHSQYTGDLEKDSSYDEDKVLKFLNDWTPGAVAEKKAQQPDS